MGGRPNRRNIAPFSNPPAVVRTGHKCQVSDKMQGVIYLQQARNTPLRALVQFDGVRGTGYKIEDKRPKNHNIHYFIE